MGKEAKLLNNLDCHWLVQTLELYRIGVIMISPDFFFQFLVKMAWSYVDSMLWYYPVQRPEAF